MAKRVSTGKKLRFEVLKRDGFVCQYCGACPPKVLLVIDHITPVADGGETEIDNLVTACEPCNQGKAARPLSAIPEGLSSKAERVAEAEEQIRGYQEIMRARADRIEGEAWEVAEMLWPGSSEKGAQKSDLVSIRRFIEQIGVVKVMEMADVAVARKPWGGRALWQYFCGCCWRCIRGEGT